MLGASLLLFAPPATRAAAPPLPPKPGQYLTDRAGVFDAARATALNAKLAQFERDTSSQVLVYIDRRVPEGTTIEEMGSAAIHAWGVGQKGKDNGVILFVFTDDHKMRIEVGYGLESSLSDARSGEILGTIVKPRFRRGDLQGGVEAGVDAILAAARGEGSAGTGKTVAERPGPMGVSIPFWVVMLVFGSIALFVAFLVVKAIVDAVRGAGKHGAARRSARGSAFSLDTFSSSSSSDSSSSDSSSSDFSGGGGDGGGGGASDSW